MSDQSPSPIEAFQSEKISPSPSMGQRSTSISLSITGSSSSSNMTERRSSDDGRASGASRFDTGDEA